LVFSTIFTLPSPQTDYLPPVIQSHSSLYISYNSLNSIEI